MQPQRIFVISDLHLGGEAPAMMSRPRDLAALIQRLPTRLAADERLELVIAGDFVDFLSIPPFAAWTIAQEDAVQKLHQTMRGPPFACVFDALGAHVAAGHALTILVGNHDVELGLPDVQDALLDHIGASRHQVHFVDDNRAYRVGGLAIEHGNRYDGANENDWSGLRAIASALSRGETPRDELEPSAGSRLVASLISPLKAQGYPFVDLLQPQGELVALLLVAFEPSVMLDLPKIGRILQAKRLQAKNGTGLQPGETRHVSFRQDARPDVDLQAAFGGAYEALRTANEQVGFGDLVLTAWQARKDSLRSILDRGEKVPIGRLQQIRLAMQKMLLGVTADVPDGDTEQYGAAARRLVESNARIEVVVMGHTHLPRHIGPEDRATYLNTGTWADVIRVPNAVLDDPSCTELAQFLQGLCSGAHRTCPATFADIRVESTGQVTAARLCRESMR